MYIKIAPNKLVAVGGQAHKDYIEANKPKVKPKAKPKVDSKSVKE